MGQTPGGEAGGLVVPSVLPSMEVLIAGCSERPSFLRNRPPARLTHTQTLTLHIWKIFMNEPAALSNGARHFRVRPIESPVAKWSTGGGRKRVDQRTGHTTTTAAAAAVTKARAAGR